jgi:hypothetical protein
MQFNRSAVQVRHKLRHSFLTTERNIINIRCYKNVESTQIEKLPTGDEDGCPLTLRTQACYDETLCKLGLFNDR